MDSRRIKSIVRDANLRKYARVKKGGKMKIVVYGLGERERLY